MIVAKVRGQRELLIESPQQVLDSYTENDKAEALIDDMVMPLRSRVGASAHAEL